MDASQFSGGGGGQQAQQHTPAATFPPKPQYGNQSALFGAAAGNAITGNASAEGRPTAQTGGASAKRGGGGHFRGRGAAMRGGGFKNRSAVFKKPQDAPMSEDEPDDQGQPGEISNGYTAVPMQEVAHVASLSGYAGDSDFTSHLSNSHSGAQPSIFGADSFSGGFLARPVAFGQPSFTSPPTFGSAFLGSATSGPSTTSAFGSQPGPNFTQSQVAHEKVAIAPAMNSPAVSGVAMPSTAASALPATTLNAFLRKPKASGSSTPGSAMQSGVSTPAIDDDEERALRFAEMPANNRFFEMKAERDALRAHYIATGILPDPEKAQDLADAQKLIGTCKDMCPEFEREEREFQKELDRWEVFPGTSRADPRLAVKKYRRPAAGREVPLPEDVRPPIVLKQTLDYLFHELLPPDPFSPRYAEVHPFLWDRTRAIRQDFIVQSQRGPLTIECHERIARFHILSLHLRGGFDAEGKHAEGWSEQQELEQLRKTLRSLIEYYDDTRESGEKSPNEAEFRAYNVLLHLRDPETLREVELLPTEIFVSPVVQSSLRLRSYAQRSNNLEKRGHPRNTEATLNFYSRFFAELRTPHTNYLQACLAENVFPGVRLGAVKAMGKAYLANHHATPAKFVATSLGADGVEQMLEIAELFKIKAIWEGQEAFLAINKANALPEDRTLSGSFSKSIVEAKRGTFTNQDIIDGATAGAEPLSIPSLAGQPQSSPMKPSFSDSLRSRSALSFDASPLTPSATLSMPLPKSAAFAQAFKPANPSPLAQPATPESSAALSTNSTPFSQTTFPSPSAFKAFGSANSPSSSNDKVASGAAVPTSVFGRSAVAAPENSSASTFGSQVTTMLPTVQERPSSRPESAGFTLPPARESSRLALQDLSAVRKRQRSASESIDDPLARRSGAPPMQSSTLPEIAQPLAESKENSPDGRVLGDLNTDTSRNDQQAADAAAAERAARKKEEEKRERAIAAAAAKAREELEARKRAREDWMEGWISDLLYRALDAHLGRRVKAHARHALAGAFHERQTMAAAIRVWRKGLDKILEERRMVARLEKVRERLKEKNLARSLGNDDTNTTFSSSVQSHSMEMLKSDLRASRSSLSQSLLTNGSGWTCASDDQDDLSVQTAQARAACQSLWNAGTFLHVVAECVGHTLSLVQYGLVPRFTTLLRISTDDEETKSANTALWLRSKFGILPGESDVAVEVGSGTRLRILDVSADLAPPLDNLREDVGLAFFSVSPALSRAGNDATQSLLWTQEKSRLADLHQHPTMWGSRLKPVLIIVVWASPQFLSVFSPLRTVRAHQIKARLLEPASALRWSNIQVAEIGLHTDDPEAALHDATRAALSTLVWNSLRAQTSLRSLSQPLLTSWSRAVDSTVLALDEIYGLNLTATREAAVLAVDALAALIVLANDALTTLQNVSETICDEGEVISLPYVQRDLNEQTVDSAFFKAAEKQLCSAQLADESSLLSIRALLYDAIAAGQHFPFQTYVHCLLQAAISQLELVWLGVSEQLLLPVDGKPANAAQLRILEEAERIEALGLSLTDHIRTTCRTITHKFPQHATGNESLLGQQTSTKTSETVDVVMPRPSPPPPSSHRIADLKAAMANAMHFLQSES